MVYLTKEYYTETFGGTAIPDEDFDRMARIASDVIDSICKIKIDPERHDMDRISAATAYEAEYLYSEGGVNAITGKASSQTERSESLDDHSVSEKRGNAFAEVSLTVGGVPVSTLAYQIVKRLGLTSRWAYAERERRRRNGE